MATKKKNSKKKLESFLGIIASIVAILGFFNITGYKLCSPGETESRILSKSPNNKAQKVEGNTPPKTRSKSGLGRKPIKLSISNATAVLVVENEKIIDWPLSSLILKSLQKRGVKTTSPPIFQKSFLTTGDFSNLFNGDVQQDAMSTLPIHFKNGVLGKKTVIYKQNPELSNLITASMTVKLHVISSRNGAIKFSFSCSQYGAGFSKSEASNNAKEKIIKEIESKISKIIDSLEN